MSSDTYIAVAWGSPGGATAEISNAIEDLTGKRPKPIRLSDLAGPNETIQILLSIDDWIKLGEIVLAIYGTELIKEIAKATWRVAAPKLTQSKDAVTNYFRNLVSAIREARHAKAPVVLGYYRTPKGGRRHIGIEITDDNPEEIGRTIILLASHGQEINLKLDELDSLQTESLKIAYEENSDCSVKIIITDDGVLQIRVTTFDDKFANRKEITHEFFE